MTQEDLNQIRAIMREEVRAIVREETRAVVREEIAALRLEFDEKLTSAVVAIRQEFAERLGAAVVSLGADFSDLRQEMIRRIDEVSRRLQTLDRRMDRIAETNSDVVSQLAALNDLAKHRPAA